MGFARDWDAYRGLEVCARAFARTKNAVSGKWFEEAAAGPLENFSVRRLLNDVDSKGKKLVGAAAGAGETWKYPGRTHSGGAGNFDIFDFAIRGPGNRTRLGSCADGGMEYLVRKLRIVCEPDPEQFDRVVEELRFLAQHDPTLGIPGLGTMTQAAARQEVASRAALLVHPDSVQPLRAVVASHPMLDEILAGFMKLRGLTDRAKALEDLLGSILPGIDLS